MKCSAMIGSNIMQGSKVMWGQRGQLEVKFSRNALQSLNVANATLEQMMRIICALVQQI